MLSFRGSTLEECLRENFSSESNQYSNIELSDYYECEKCKSKTKAMKHSLITKTPNFLVIVMKKFTSTGKKIDERVSYQHKLDIRKNCKGHYG